MYMGSDSVKSVFIGLFNSIACQRKCEIECLFDSCKAYRRISYRNEQKSQMSDLNIAVES
jgi:hypothetical protein